MKHFSLLRCSLLAFICCCFTSTGAQLIFSKAGGAPGNGDYFPATQAGLSNPAAVAIDAYGNLYIADKWSNNLRKVDAATKIITTIAGRGLPSDFKGDGGPAIEAAFGLLWGVAVDDEGNLYLSDHNNFRIRKVNAATGIITTIAGNGTEGFSGDGGPATLASMGQPSSLTVDRQHNVYFVDAANDRLRKISADDGLITTVAGNGIRAYSGDGGPANAASVGGLCGVAVDSTGNVYLADGSHRIRKVDAFTGTITTIAGNGLTDFSGDGGPATAASFGLAGPVSQDQELALDAKGNIYIEDVCNRRIRKLDAITGTITTLAGSGAFGYSGEGGPATSAGLGSFGGITIDKKENLYIIDGNTNQIRKVEASTGVITTVAGNGKTYYLGDGKKGTGVSLLPLGLALDQQGNIFVLGGDLLRKIDAVTGVVTTVAGADVQFGIDKDSINALQALLNSPTGAEVDQSGNLYIVNQRQVRKVDAVTGMITAVVGNGFFDPNPPFPEDSTLARAVTFTELAAIALDSIGNIYVSDAQCRCVRKVDAVTNVLTTIAGSKTGIAGTSGDGGPATGALLYLPGHLAFDKKGNLYIVDGYVNRIRKVDAVSGIITTVVGTGGQGYAGDGGPATQATLNQPIGIDFDEHGNLYIADRGNNLIRKVDAATGIITTIAGNGTASFSGDGSLAVAAGLHSPFDVVVDKKGLVYVADYENHRVRYICPATGLASAATASMGSVGVDQSNQAVFEDNCSLQAKLTASGTHPVLGRVADSVWIEPSVPTVNGQPYVPRHYGITPQLNASTATGTLTLYFTQADFTAYNAAPNHGPDLPIDAADAAGNKANLRIKKRSGTSSDGTGRFDAYSGATADIIPTAVVWEPTVSAWAVTFGVSGFSGFFVTSSSSTLPVTLVNFTARLHNTDVVIEWATAGEQRLAAYEVERSVDGRRFSTIGRVLAANGLIQAYNFVDRNMASLTTDVLYYRLKIVAENGSSTYSNTVLITIGEIGATVLLYPNPASSVATLQLTSLYNGHLHLQVVDANGRTVLSKQVTVVKGNNKVLLAFNKLTSGVYTVLISGATGIQRMKFVKR